MKNRRKQNLFLPVFALFASTVFAQEKGPASLQHVLLNYRATSPEKVFLHTDQTVYLAGETIWFKAYVVNAISHKPADVSKVLYAELFDSKSTAVLKVTLPLKQGLGDGYFSLPASLPTGSYRLRAYSAWMKNNDPAFAFQQELQIINTSKRPNWPSLESKPAYTVGFYPEGGNLVAGLESKLGFQFLDQYGNGVDGEGFLFTDRGDTVARFRPLKFGTGSFLFRPQKGVAYKAVVRLANGDVLPATLPSVAASGYVLRATTLADGAVHLAATGSTNGNETLYLLGHTRGEQKFSAAARTQNGAAEWTVPTAQLGDGISCFTLFDADGKPLCERLIFKRPIANVQLRLQADTSTYAQRSAVNVQVSVEGNQASSGNWSLAVFKLDSLQPAGAPLIDQYLLLSSDIKGRVESPGYYFEKKDAEHNAALDNLLLTQGWRRFRWEDVSADATRLAYLPDYEGPVLHGTIRQRQSGNPVAGALAYLSVPGEHFFAGNAVSNSKGELVFATRNVYGAVDLAVQPAGADSTLRVDLQNPFWEVAPTLPSPAFRLPEQWKGDLARRHTEAQVRAAFASVNIEWRQPNTDTLAFYGRPDNKYRLDEYTRFPTMEEVMREIVAEVRVRKRADSFSFSVLNLPYRLRFEESPLVLFDGVPLASIDKLMAFDPLKLKSIDVVARKYFWGNTVNNGIVSYHSYEGNLAGLPLDAGVTLLAYNGLQIPREFYSPVYDTPERLQSREPDRRTLLFWQPNVSTGADGKASLGFYTSDVPGRYAIVVQGLTAAGAAASGTTTIEVR